MTAAKPEPGALPQGEAKAAALAAGCNEFLTKPIKRDTVLRVLDRYAVGEAARRPRPTASVHAPADRSDTDDLTRLKTAFIANRHLDFAAVQSAITNREFEAVRTIGHRIKGLAGSYGLEEIGIIGGHIERAALDQDMDGITRYIEQLREAVGRAEAADGKDRGQERPAA